MENAMEEIRITYQQDNIIKNTSIEKPDNDIVVITYLLDLSKQNNSEFEFCVSFPYTNCAGVFHPSCGLDRSNKADWSGPVRSMTASSAPMLSIFSDNSINRCTIALSETMEKVEISSGIREEDGMFQVKIRIPLLNARRQEDYEFQLYIDMRPSSFSCAVRNVSAWWEQECNMKSLQIPKEAKEPLYSAWYSFHQNVIATKIEKECELASKMGFKSIIVDDGWQTSDNNRGYAYCGDWDVSTDKIPDMGKHVQTVQKMGMKYILWYSVPFVGRKSRNWTTYKDKLLYYIDRLEAGVLDPRYPEVRDFLVKTYENAVENYGLDGLKLDFIDSFTEHADTPKPNENMDYADLQQAVDVLMSTIIQKVTALKDNFLIEFRQSYIGPNMRKYGNLFRVGDCPASGIRNRVGCIDLRLLLGNSAVHSDMLMWHGEEKPEEIALQIISCIFATVQISTLLENLNEEQQKAVQFWVAFMIEHQKILLETPIEALEPHNLYPTVIAEDSKQKLQVLYSQDRMVRYEHDKEMIVINGTQAKKLYVELAQTETLSVQILNCMGEEIDKTIRQYDAGLHCFHIDTGSVIMLIPSHL